MNYLQLNHSKNYQLDQPRAHRDYVSDFSIEATANNFGIYSREIVSILYLASTKKVVSSVMAVLSGFYSNDLNKVVPLRKSEGVDHFLTGMVDDLTRDF